MAQRLLFWKKLLAGVTSGSAVIRSDINPNVRELVVYAVFSAGVSAGVVSLECAHDESYAGTWAAEGTMGFAADSVKKLNVTGLQLARRVNVTTTIVGGTVDVYVAMN